MTHNAIDTAYLVETPEGIDLEAQLAGPIPRILAYSIDLLFRAIFLGVISIIALLFFQRMGMGVILILSFLLEWFYPVIFEVYRKGQTPGKKRLHLAVVNDNLTPVTWGASMTRNLLRAADFFPFAYLFGLITMTTGKRFQRLGDIAAGTIVIHRPPVQDSVELPQCDPIMSPITLELEDHVALVNYAQRHKQLTQARQQELAEILSDVTRQKPGSAVAYLHGIGNWLLGAR